jgi:general stress protein 26
MEIATVHPDYGDASAPAPPWNDIDQRLTDAQLYWMVTVRRDGRPHAVPLCGVWSEGRFVFCTGDQEQKARNLESNPRVTVTAGPLGAEGWSAGKDIAVEGVVERITDDDELHRLADLWLDKYDGDWRFDVRDGRFVQVVEDGEGGHDGAMVFRVAPTKVLVFGDDHGQTRYRP